MKEAGTAHWSNPNVGATNESGFTALPGNIRFSDGTFSPSTTTPFMGLTGHWWTSTEFIWDPSTFYGSVRSIDHYYSSIESHVEDKRYGFSVRCIRDLPN
jgi:uncharacterized protein (TIGR02145 family)